MVILSILDQKPSISIERITGALDSGKDYVGMVIIFQVKTKPFPSIKKNRRFLSIN